MGTKQSKKNLTENDIQMIEKHTGLSRNDIENWHAAFILDCPSGTLNKEQFIRFYSDLYPDAAKAKTYSQYVFRAFDKDKSGYIDFCEFLIAFSIAGRQNTDRERITWIFNMYDTDHNGYIDRNEMIEMLDAIFDMLNVDRRALENTPEYRVQMIMTTLDRDMDDRISSEEFIDGVCKDNVIRKLLLPD